MPRHFPASRSDSRTTRLAYMDLFAIRRQSGLPSRIIGPFELGPAAKSFVLVDSSSIRRARILNRGAEVMRLATMGKHARRFALLVIIFQNFSSNLSRLPSARGSTIRLARQFRLKEDTHVTSIETRRYEMLVRVRDFGEKHGSLFPESSVAREQFVTVEAAVKQLGQHAVTKMSAVQEGKSTKAMAREALLDGIEGMALTARAIAADTPDLKDKFRVPVPRTDQALLTAGRLFARDAEEFKDQFLAHAMPQTFLADLIGLVERFEQTIQEREEGKGGSTAARASIKAALASGTTAVQKIDAMMTNHLRGDPATTALWRSVRRIGHPHRARSVVATSPPVPSAPTPVGLSATPPPVVAPLQTTSPSSAMEKAS